MKRRVNQYLFSVSLLLAGCIPDPLEVKNIPAITPKIVVSSQMIPGNGVAILLTKSIGALEANDNSNPLQLLDQIAVNDAFVTIQSESSLDTLQLIGSGVYGGLADEFTPGKSYTLKVFSPTMGSVSAKTIVKQVIRFSSIDASLYVTGRDTLAQVEYEISDGVGKNWYMVNAQRITRRNPNEQLLNPQITTKLLDDTSFEGQTKTDAFKVFARRIHRGDTLAVFLSNINKDYYDFMKIREDTRFGLVDFIAEPINYPSNVEGGLGFFNLYLPDVHIFTLE